MSSLILSSAMDAIGNEFVVKAKARTDTTRLIFLNFIIKFFLLTNFKN